MGLIRRTPTAVRDLKGIWFHIAETSDTAAADRLLDEIERRVRLLSEVPGIGRPRFDLRPRLRSSPVGKYLIFYRAIR